MNRIALTIACAAILPGSAFAQAMLSGPDGLSVSLTPESLGALPSQEIEVSYLSSKGEQSARYKGVLLWDLIARETELDDDVKSALRRIVLVKASDDHQVAFSIGEIAPDFGDTPILLAYEVDGAPVPGGLQMVAPGDKRGARYIKEIVALELR
ncbi:hypothetical protein [uncultured Paracoccus sp.]|nr:hypothetical protein [uncultured Paracoccus sp.]